MPMATHPDGAAILDRIRAAGIHNLYHFTCVDNLPGIRAAGAICSKDMLERRGAWPPLRPGGNELSHRLDRDLDRWGHLALSFTPRTPMAYHRKQQDHLCFFRIKPEVAAIAGVRFTDTNAASYAATTGEGLDGLALVNFAAITSRPRPGDRDGWVRPVQAEALIPGQIRLAEVDSVAFVSQASLDEGLRQWGPHPHPDFVVDRGTFADGPGTTITYPFIDQVAITDASVDEATGFAGIAHQSVISLAAGRATIVASVGSASGLVLTTTWRPSGISESETFPTSGVYWYWSSSAAIARGLAAVEIRLRDVRWVTVPFDVGT